MDVVGCRWDDLDPAIQWPIESAALSARDTESGTYADMIAKFEQLYALHSASPVV
jgi:hypothetical protein